MIYYIVGRYGYNNPEIIDSAPNKTEALELFNEYFQCFGVGQKGSKWNLWIEDQNKNKIDF